MAGKKGQFKGKREGIGSLASPGGRVAFLMKVFRLPWAALMCWAWVVGDGVAWGTWLRTVRGTSWGVQ